MTVKTFLWVSCYIFLRYLRQWKMSPGTCGFLQKKAGKISAAWCNCTAGTFVCNHIIAALYKIEHANIMGFNDPAYTDMPCRWNHSKTAHVTGVRMNEVLIKKSVRSKEKSSSSILRDKRHSSVLIHDTIVKRW